MTPNQTTYEELKSDIRELISPLDGIVLVDAEDGGLDCFIKSNKSYWVIAALDEVAAELGKPIFMRKTHMNPSDEARMNMLDYFWDGRPNPWIPIDRFDDESDAVTIERYLGKPREEIYLGFGGALSESCVKTKLLALCSEVEIPDVQRDTEIQWNIDKIGLPFGRGLLLYEFTENKYVGFSNSLRFNAVLEERLVYERTY